MLSDAPMSKPDSDAGLFDIMYTCRAMRRLKPDPVPEPLLLQLVDAALQGPSGSNAQNWTFIIVRDRAQKERIAATWKPTWDFYLETFARAEARPGEDLAARERMIAVGTQMVTSMADVPAIFCIGVKRDEQLAKVLSSPATLASAARHLGIGGTIKLVTNGTRTGAIADGSTAYPAVQNFLLAARALGLGAVLTTPHFFVPGAFERVLGIPKTVTLAAIVPVGYPVGNFGPVKRPPASAVVSWDRYRA
jgi:nitroreductase